MSMGVLHIYYILIICYISYTYIYAFCVYMPYVNTQGYNEESCQKAW